MDEKVVRYRKDTKGVNIAYIKLFGLQSALDFQIIMYARQKIK
jgi:hypothetical protein